MENNNKKVVCRYDTNIKYVGKIPNLFDYGGIWNCTDFARDIEGNFVYIVQPLYESGNMHGYTGFQVLALTEEQLIENFVVVEDNKEYPIKSAELSKDEINDIAKMIDKLYAKDPNFDEY